LYTISTIASFTSALKCAELTKKNVFRETLFNELQTTLRYSQNVCHVCPQTTTLAPFAVFGLLFDELLESLGEGTQTLTFISNLTASVGSLFGEYRVTHYEKTLVFCTLSRKNITTNVSHNTDRLQLLRSA